MFCKKFEKVVGKDHCTPNRHLHLHLKDCLLDYGPVYAFWCFAFKRYNGMLGAYPTNQRNIEVQIMKKCLLDQQLKSLNFPDGFEQLQELLYKHHIGGGLLQTQQDEQLTNMPTAL